MNQSQLIRFCKVGSASDVHSAKITLYQIQGSHFSGLTKFPDFPVFFAIFQYSFNVLFFLTENLIHFSKLYTVHLNIIKNIK